MQKLTKITASIGTASEKPTVLQKMIESGVNVCRLNFSHDTRAVQGAKFDAIRKIAKKLGRPIAIVADMQGPKHRIGDFKTEDRYPLKPGQEFILDNNPERGDSTRVYLPDRDVLNSLKVGDRVLLNDGKIELEIIKNANCKPHIASCSVTTRVIRGTEIWSRRGFNLPDTKVLTSILTPKDRIDLEYALDKKPDFVAISFVQKPEDIEEVRDFINARTSLPVKIIAKIERPQALDRIEDIVGVSDAIMFARGDLAVEVPFERLPALQRKLIRICRNMNRPIIVATQMLGSMVHSDFPLRAEISDVANAAYLRADSTMTSEETTISDNPVNVIETMAKILANADEDSIENHYDWSQVENMPENDWSRSVANMACLNKAAGIVVFDRSGKIATDISCRRPDMPIIAVCNQEIVANQLCLSRGVQPMFDEAAFGQRNINAACEFVGISRGKIVVVDDEAISLAEINH